MTILTGCNSFKNTNNEDKGIKEVLDLYGGQCKYSVGFNASTEHETEKYYKMEISGSDVIEKYSDIVQMPASGIAYTFYKNLAGERKNYSDIKVNIIFNDGSKKEFNFKTKDLEVVDHNIPKVLTFVDLMKKNNYTEVGKYFADTNIVSFKVSDMLTGLSKSDSAFGNIKSFTFYGYRFNDKNGINYLHISGALDREKQPTEFSVDVNPTIDKDFYYIKMAL